MNGSRFLAMAALVAAMASATTVQAQKTMYRCGNNYQDRPCDDGQESRVVGTTGTSKPAADTVTVCENNKCRTVSVSRTPASAKGDAESAEKAADRQMLDALSKDIHAQHKARECVKLRKLLGETKQQYYRVREAYQGDLRRLGCAPVAHEDLDAERKCADADGRAERAEACGAYAQVGKR